MKLRGTAILCAIFMTGLILSEAVSAEGTPTQILDNGPRNNRLNIVFLAEGYTSAQQADFDADADGILGHMLSKSPFGEYGSFLNAFTIYVESAESGADHPSSGIYKDTYFDATYDTYGIARLLTISSAGYNKVYNLLAEHLPEYDIIVVIVNDTQYGGSGGSLAVTSTASSAPIRARDSTATRSATPVPIA